MTYFVGLSLRFVRCVVVLGQSDGYEGPCKHDVNNDEQCLCMAQFHDSCICSLVCGGVCFATSLSC